MNSMNILEKIFIIGIGVFVLISGELLLYKDMISFTPWKTSGTLRFVAYGTGNTDRIGIIANARSSVLVLNSDKELLYQLDAKPSAAQSFVRAESLQFDEANNLYILDTNFGGVFEQSYERVLKYSEEGAFLGEIYRYEYINDDFSITRGKLQGMTYHQGDIYLVRLGEQGFWLEQVQTAGSGNVDIIAFFDYPHAFRELGYCGINAGQKELALITKSGLIKQYDFSGTLSGTWAGTESDSLPWWVIYGQDNTIIYTDLHTAEIVRIDIKTGKRQVLFTTSQEHPYYVLSATKDLIFAASFADTLLIRNQEGSFETLDTYYYTPWFIFKRKVLFALCLLDIPPFLLSLAALMRWLVKLRWSKNGTLIFTLGIGITFGAGIATVLITDKMHEQYNESTFSGLENISRFMASRIDVTQLRSLASPRDYEGEAYQALRGQLYDLFAHTQFKGKRVYQRIWEIQEGGRQDLVYDLENSVGMFYPGTNRDDSYIKKVFESASYVQGIEVNASGQWLYACGPIEDSTGTVRAVIETGYDLRSVQEEIRRILITTVILGIAVLLGSIWLLIFALLIISGRRERGSLVSGLSDRGPLRVYIKPTTSLVASYEQGEFKGIAIDLLYEIGRRLHKALVFTESAQNQVDIIAGDVVKISCPPAGWKCSRSYARYRNALNQSAAELCFLYPENSIAGKQIDDIIRILSKEQYLSGLINSNYAGLT